MLTEKQMREKLLALSDEERALLRKVLSDGTDGDILTAITKLQERIDALEKGLAGEKKGGFFDGLFVTK